MTVVRKQPPRSTAQAAAAPAPSPGRISSASRRPSAFARYFTRTGWVHALLLMAVWLFIFPFIWMVSTSMKTDEELPDAAILPSIPTFRPSSPYVKPEIEPQRPGDVTVERWEELLPKLLNVAADKIAVAQGSAPLPDTLVAIGAEDHRGSAATFLVSQAVGKLHKALWTGGEAKLVTEFESFLTPTAIDAALARSLARLELLTFQIRTLDVHIHPLTTGPEFAERWTVESGPAKLLTYGGSTLLSYDFSNDDMPIVLRHDFNLPRGVEPQDLHKLIVSIQADNSWHNVNATLDLAGTRWTSRRTSYIAQFRPMSFIFQPPTFDDEMLRPKNWIPLRSAGPSPVNADDPKRATLRLTIAPSSTPQAIYGKFIRNYLRAFDAVPFWRYISNSVILVVLNTLGALFSASFVAYAFARLSWPGRSVAFLILLSTMMLPAQVTMIPGFMVWRGLNWYNTLNPLWVPSFFGSAFFIFLMTQHMRTIPKELEEAARIDGLNPVQSWWYIILPNVKPTLAAISILSFMGSWNEFMGPLIYLRDQAKFPLSLGLYGLRVDQTAPDWTMLMAGNMLMTLPVIAIFFLFQRYFVQGMTMTGMKG